MFRIWMLAFIFSGAARVSAQQPSVGLALSGGGARGLTHIGVLRALEEKKIPVSKIAGTSVGGLIGAMYACGYSVDEIEAIMTRADWPTILSDEVERSYLSYRRKQDDNRYVFNLEVGFKGGKIILPQGLFGEHNLSNFLFRVFLPLSHIQDYSQLPIGLTLVATDLKTGDKVLLTKGDLAQSVHATMAFSGLLSPVTVEDKELIDGLYVQNLPISELKNQNVDFIIAVDASLPLKDPKDLNTFFEVNDQAMGIVTRNRTEQEKKLANVVIAPDLGVHENFDFTFARFMIDQGRAKALEELERFVYLSISPEAYAEYQRRRQSQFRPAKKLNAIEVSGIPKAHHKRIRRLIRIDKNHEINPQTIENNSKTIFGLGEFEKVSIHANNSTETATDLLIRVKEKSWGPRILRFGVDIDSQFKRGSEFMGLISLQWNQLNRFGAQLQQDAQLGSTWGLSTEWYQPLWYNSRFFFSPTFSLRYEDIDFLPRKVLNETTIFSLDGLNEFGFHFTTSTEIRLGHLISRVRAPTFTNVLSAWTFKLDVDYLEKTLFPQRGWNLMAEGFASQAFIGSDLTFYLGEASLNKYFGFGSHTLMFGVAGGTDFQSNSLSIMQFPLGGVRTAFGRDREYYRERHYEQGKVLYRKKLNIQPSFLYRGVYAGITAEVTHIPDDILYSSLLEFNVDTKMGSFSLAFGQTNFNAFQGFLKIGPDLARRPRLFY